MVCYSIEQISGVPTILSKIEERDFSKTNQIIFHPVAFDDAVV
jgi:hypothetical protein